jgi:GWxTD domain-containing protein
MPWLAGLFLVLLPGTPAPPQPQPDIEIRITRFWRSDRTLLEGVIARRVSAADVSATPRITVLVTDSSGNVLHTESWTDTVPSRVASVARARGSAELTRPFSLGVTAGSYWIKVAVDREHRSDTARLAVRGFTAPPVISDVIVSSRIRALAQGDQPVAGELRKGRYAVEQGPRVVIMPTDPTLWYYVELYGAGDLALKTDLEFAVTRSSGGAPLFRTTRTLAPSAGSIDAARIPLQGLPPGDFILTVTARRGGLEEVRQAPFTMGTMPTAVADVAGTEGALFDQYFTPALRNDSTVRELVEALVLAAPGEAVSKSTQQLPVDAQRRYLARYWSRIPDPAPATPKHELLEEFAERVRFVAREYREREIGRSGVATDRGRIYLKYGAPDAKLPLPMTNNRAVEVWKYSRLRNLKYAFLDETGFHNFNLVFTTDPYEQSAADWQERVGDPETIRQILGF